MRALSGTPWWFWLVLQGMKDVENRKMRTHLRGSFLLHASLPRRKDRQAVVEWLADVRPVPLTVYCGGGRKRGLNIVWFGPDEQAPRAFQVEAYMKAHPWEFLPGYRFNPPPRGIIGVANLTRCEALEEYRDRVKLRGSGIPSPWAFGPWVWGLADVQRFARPIPCTGALGFWRVPEFVMMDVAEQLRPLPGLEVLLGA